MEMTTISMWFKTFDSQKFCQYLKRKSLLLVGDSLHYETTVCLYNLMKLNKNNIIKFNDLQKDRLSYYWRMGINCNETNNTNEISNITYIRNDCLLLHDLKF